MYEILKQVKSANPAFYKELVLDLLYSQPCSQASYQYLRYLYQITNGAFNQEVQQLYSLFRPKQTFPIKDGILWQSSPEAIDNAVKSIKDDGIYIFPVNLDRPLLDEIYNYSMNLQVTDWEGQNSFKASEIVEHAQHSKFSKARYSFNISDLIACKAFQKIVFDPSLLFLSQEYLSCFPILDNICMWFSMPLQSSEIREQELTMSAQKFHYDLDRIKFIKFFIYLNHIDPTNGPFTYIKGSHHFKPKNFRDGRYENTEIDEFYHPSRKVEVTGDAGTIIACDTSGFHKGKPLERGFRLILQLEYAVSLFGTKSPFKPIEIDKKNFDFGDRFERYKKCYSVLFHLVDRQVAAQPKQKEDKPKKHFSGAPYENITYISSNNLNKYYSRYVLSRQFKWFPKPILNSSSKRIFTIGSCFANELRAYLDRQGGYITSPKIPLNTLEYFHPLSKEVTSWGEWDGSSNFQHYNTFSIRQ